MAAPTTSHETSAADQARTVTMAKALNLAMRSRMETDPGVLVMGEDVGQLGGVFRITDGLHKDFGGHRVLDTPLSEAGIVGTAIGLAMRGYRPVCEIQFDGFIFPGFDQIVSQLAKMRFRTQGKLSMPVVIRVPYGGGIGAVEHHSESPESLFAHVAGLKVMSCSNPSDAYWMLRQAIDSDDPVLFFEPKRRYYDKAEVDPAAEPEPLGTASVVRSGSAATLVTYGPMVRTCLDAADAATEDGNELEVIDLRGLSPLDLTPVVDSVRRTGRVVVVAEAPAESSVTSEVASRLQRECFYSLESPVLRVTGFDTPYPPSKLEDGYLPDLDRVLDAVDEALSY